MVKDPNTSVNFMVDTGSAVSLLPCSRSAGDKRFTGHMTAANGTLVPTYETIPLTVTFGLRKSFKWNFVRAGVSCAILGLEFLTHFGFVLDLANKTLHLPCHDKVDAKLTRPRCGSTIKEPDVSIVEAVEHVDNSFSSEDEALHKDAVLDHKSCPELPANVVENSLVGVGSFDLVDRLCTFYSDLFEVDNFKKPTKHKTQHHIRTSGPPCVAKVRKLSPEKLEILRTELDKLLQLGIIYRSESEWASLVHLVQKKGGGWRITGDFCQLNRQTISDRYSIPLLSDFVGDMEGSIVFSSLDLYKGYHQVEIAPEDQCKTSIITPLGNFAFRRLPMGISCAANSFQRFMHEVLQGIPNVFCFIDDLLIFSRNEKEHFRHLQLVFERLSQYGLILNRDKCIFKVPEIDFLGHRISHKGVLPLVQKVEAIQNFPMPKTMRQLRQFLGMINFYRRFIPQAGALLHPLERLLSPQKNSKKSIPWSEESIDAFESARHILANVTSLAFPIKGGETILTCDASDGAVGAALNQVVSGELTPIGFFSKSLNATQKNYPTFDRELLAIFLAIKHFRYFLDGRDFVIETDHSALVFALRSNHREYSGRRLRQLQFISEFTSNIRHIEGKQNVVADCLSRPPDIGAVFGDFQTVDLLEIAAEQQTDSEIIDMIRDKTHSLCLEKVTIPCSSECIWVDKSCNVPRILVPQKLRFRIFDEVHSLAHPGVKVTRELIGQRFVWKGMRKDVAMFVRTCILCQQSKIVRHNKTPLQRFKTPDARFAHIHCDIVGPLLECNGFSYLMTFINRFTRHVEVAPLKGTSAKECADAFLHTWVARFGCPTELTCDRGVQFTSHLWNELCSFLGCKLNHTCAQRWSVTK